MTAAEWRNPRRGYIASQRAFMPERRRHKAYRMRTARGEASMIDSGIVKAHIRDLCDMGFSANAIGAAAGIPQQTVSLILDGTWKRTRIPVAARITSVTHVPVPAQKGTCVPAIGARRRIQALNAIGWGRPAIGELLGVKPKQINGYISQHSIQYATWAAIANVYDRLSGAPGPDVRMVTWARNRGWPPPLAWEGRDMDHPDAKPDLGDDTKPTGIDEVLLARLLAGTYTGPRVLGPEREAVLDHAIEHGWTKQHVAQALNLKLATADQALIRRRRELRNAEETAA